MMKKERSRAYPVQDLGFAYEILTGKLAGIGDSRLDRDALAEILGYCSGGGGVAARKVSSLVQYGVLDRDDGHYKLSRLGHHLQGLATGTEEFFRVIRIALERPVLFGSILARYRPLGRVPEDLARVLTEHYGITAKASKDAEGVFIQSAVFAEVLDVQGRFLQISSSSVPLGREPTPLSEPQSARFHKGYPLPLKEERSASLEFPPQMSARELEILEARLLSDIRSGMLWDYLGLRKPSASEQSPAKHQDAADQSNVVQIRPAREP